MMTSEVNNPIYIAQSNLSVLGYMLGNISFLPLLRILEMSQTRTCIFAHICLSVYVHTSCMHFSVYLCMDAFYSPSVSTLARVSCLLLNHKSPAILPTSQHISARKLFATFFIQVSAVTAPLSLLASRLQRVSGSKHEHVRGT